ncbi:MAG TPA: gephyrin-like molybdotransferase Glp [Dehalococcoidales bacterium]|nr:gephyrin-like molybdotransferase Glp [Dehalococcoidales bacterium]
MISVEQALDKVLSVIKPLETENSSLLNCLGQVLAEDVYSQIDVPPRDNSALDGYAVRAADISTCNSKKPAFLKVIGIVAAGDTPNKPVVPGTAVRIMTGAPVPGGADAVIGFEDTDETQRKLTEKGYPAEIGIMVSEEPGANIRKAGESIKNGELVLAKGSVIRPSEIGLLASIGKIAVKVIRRPVIAILATGDEITDLGEPLVDGKIYDSNSYSVAAQVIRDGGIPKLLGIALDNEASIVDKIEQSRDADMLITIGGVSMGDYDIVKNVLAKQGEMVFWKVRSKPGKPLAFGTIKRINQSKGSADMPHLGLAGNSVSSMVNYELFVRPALLKMMGKSNLEKASIEAILEDSIKNDDGRRVFARVIVENRGGTYYARLTGPQGSGILKSMALANGLAIVPEDKSRVVKGDKLKVMMLDWLQDI